MATYAIALMAEGGYGVALEWAQRAREVARKAGSASVEADTLVTIGGSASQTTLLFFLSTHCPVCKKLLPILRSLDAAEGSALRLVLASDGEAAEHRRLAEANHLQRFPYVLASQMGIAYRVSRLPFAVLIDENGTVRAKGLVNNREQLESLLNARDLGIASVQSYLELSQPGSAV